MIGVSGPSSSIVALSMPSALRLAVRCSMVATVTPAALPMTVSMRVSTTLSPRAGTRLSRSWMSVRTKTMPVSGPAGRIDSRTRSPVCTPMPAMIAGAARVCW